jgi:hypothetical protein
MSYEDRVLALFAAANPVSNDATLRELERPSLKLLEQGEHEMSDTKIRPIDTDRPIVKQERNRGLLYGAAAAILALVVGTAAWIAFAGPGDETPDAAAGDSIAIIEDFFQKWSAGDVRGAFALVGDQDWVEGNVFIGPSMEYIAALEPDGWSWSVTDCAEQVPGTYNCRVQLVGDPVLDALDGSAGQSQFKVEDGKLTQVPRVLGVGGAQADQALAEYARIQDPSGYEAACVGANGRAWEENGVVYNGVCGAFLSQYLEALAAELTAP